MPENTDWVDRFITHLETLQQQDDRKALATLRRGLGASPGTVPGMYPYTLPLAPRYKKAEDSCFTIASLFALHPQPGGTGTLGKSFSMLRDSGANEETLERRFITLLNCHIDDLPQQLRQVIGLLKSKDISINWGQLLRDILRWDHESRFVQQQWAREYWRRTPQEGEPQKETGATIRPTQTKKEDR